jgi:hypothetical protein
MFRKALETLICASILVPAMAGCFGGGGSGGSSDSASASSSSVSLTLVDPSNPAPSSFRFTMTEVIFVAEDDSEMPLFPPASDPLATTRITHQTFGGTERYLGQFELPSGTYRSVRFHYRDAEAGSLVDPRPVVPSFAELEIPFAEPLTIAGSEHRNIRLVLDLEHSLARVGGAFLIDPLAFVQEWAADATVPLSEIVASVLDADASSRTMRLRVVHTDDARGALAEYGEVVAIFPPSAVLIPQNDQPFVAGGTSWLADFLGPNPAGQWIEVLGFLGEDGRIRVRSAEWREREFAPGHVQVEGVIIAMGRIDEGFEAIDLAVATVEASAPGVLSPTASRVRFVFPNDAPPAAHVGWTGVPIDATHLAAGVSVELEGFLLPGTTMGGAGFLSDPRSPEAGSEERLFFVNSIEILPMTVTGRIAAYPPSHPGTCVIDVDRIDGGRNDAYPRRLLVGFDPDASITTDAIVPMAFESTAIGQDVRVTGYFAPRPSRRSASGAGGGGGRSVDDGANVPGMPRDGAASLPFFVSTAFSVRGVEFEGDVLGPIDAAAMRFALTGDGSDFGYPDPTTAVIAVRSNTRIVTESTAGREVGVSPSALFRDLPFANEISVRGHVQRGTDPPVFTPSFIRVELP